MPRIEFHFDLGSPNAYLSHVVIPSIEQRTGARFVYVPILLGGVFKLTNNKSPIESLAGVRNKLEYQRLELDRFVARYGARRFRWNPHFPLSTLLLMRAAVAAEADGLSGPYVDTMFRAMWEDGLAVGDPEVVGAVLDAAGLPGARLLARAGEPAVKERLVANTEASVARGNFGAPTFFVGEEMFFGKDRLRDVEEAIVASAGAVG